MVNEQNCIESLNLQACTLLFQEKGRKKHMCIIYNRSQELLCFCPLYKPLTTWNAVAQLPLLVKLQLLCSSL